MRTRCPARQLAGVVRFEPVEVDAGDGHRPEGRGGVLQEHVGLPDRLDRRVEPAIVPVGLTAGAPRHALGRGPRADPVPDRRQVRRPQRRQLRIDLRPVDRPEVVDQIAVVLFQEAVHPHGVGVALQAAVQVDLRADERRRASLPHSPPTSRRGRVGRCRRPGRRTRRRRGRRGRTWPCLRRVPCSALCGWLPLTRLRCFAAFGDLSPTRWGRGVGHRVFFQQSVSCGLRGARRAPPLPHRVGERSEHPNGVRVFRVRGFWHAHRLLPRPHRNTRSPKRRFRREAAVGEITFPCRSR